MADLSKLISKSARVALVAFLHDLGKFAERAKIDASKEIIESHQQLYCPYHQEGRWFSHKHAAYTAIALDQIERFLPLLKGRDVAPFASWGTDDVDDSLINGAAKHHKPETFLQWVVATADRVASGFERNEFEEYNKAKEDNHYTARQLTLFEQIRLPGSSQSQSIPYDYRYKLKPLSPDALMPVHKEKYRIANNTEAQKEYRELWDGFVDGLEKIPESHRGNLPLWMDHFETLWGCYTHAIPSATAFNTRPDVSLYDHSRATAALAVALWRYHHERQDDENEVIRKMRSREDWDEQKLLFIQGDCSGIQKFIFESGGETRKYAAKLLRGRSFYVSLLTECAALKLLDRLGLPATSQILNAAGKFLIVAPNTEQVKITTKRVQQELDEWFLEHRVGESSISLATLPVRCNDLLKRPRGGSQGSPFQILMKELFEKLQVTKLQRFDLCAKPSESAIFDHFLRQFSENGVCQIDGRSPATHEYDETSMSQLARDQIDTGTWLADDQRNRIVITHEKFEGNTLQIPIFGYYVRFLREAEIGEAQSVIISGDLLRAFDISLPVGTGDTALWNGYARRCINGYVPRFNQDDMRDSAKKYRRLEGGLVEEDKIKSLDHIACEGGGENALMVLKGDVDNLGLIFQQGLVRRPETVQDSNKQPEGMTFAKMAALSRQMDAFFSIYMPWRCQKDFPDTYTIFAGGDDFFLIGPWHSQIRLAREMRQWFREYVTGNPEVNFSAGLSMTRPGPPIRYLAEQSEKALEKAKGHGTENGNTPPKNAITCYGYSVSWDCFDELITKAEKLQEYVRQNELSTGYLYGLLQFTDMQANLNSKPENTLWRSRFAYQTKRLVERVKRLDDEEKKRELHGWLAREIADNGIRKHGQNYKISLFTYLYQNREEDRYEQPELEPQKAPGWKRR